MKNIPRMFDLAIWMVKEVIEKDKSKVFRKNKKGEDFADWDYVASEVWERYDGEFDEFIINDAIDQVIIAAKLIPYLNQSST